MLACTYLLTLGTVIRSTAVKMRESAREFRCNKCHHVFTVEADIQQYYTIPRPPRWGRHCVDTLSTVTRSHSVNCHVHFWHSVNCCCSDNLSTVAVLTLCLLSLALTVCLQATELLFLHSICQVSSCTWASKIACLFRHFSTVTCLSVCQLYPSLSLSAVISHCHCLQLPVPYPSHPRPHCLSLLVSSCAVLHLLHVPNVRAYVRTYT